MNKKTSLLALLILLMGAAVRCTHLFLIDVFHAPFRLGGLFIAFAHEIVVHNFQLPVNIPYYSSGGIPFAYPPLGFYVEAVLLKIFPSGSFAIANLLPSLVSLMALALAAWYFYQWTGGWNLRSLAGLAAYVLLPNAFYNQIEAAGLAESFGNLAIIFFLVSLVSWQKKGTITTAVIAGVGLAACVVSSPGSALGGALISLVCVFDTLITLRWTLKVKPYFQLFLMGLIGLVLSAPYWLTVMINHGVSIFSAPVAMQYQTDGSALHANIVSANWFTYSVLQQDGVYFWSLAILLGIVWLARIREYFLPLAFLALFSIPRENAWLTAFPAAWLIAYGLADMLVPIIKLSNVISPRLKPSILWVSAVFITVSMTLQAFALVNLLVHNNNWMLEPTTIEALRLAPNVIPPSAKVVILGSGGLREWSPYLLQREVLNTEFGLEWQPVEYQQVILANQELDKAKSWQAVINTVRRLTSQTRVYIVFEPKSLPAGFENAQADSFSIVMNNPNLQVGVMKLP